MSYFRSQSLLLLPTLLFISPTVLSFSHGVSPSYHLQTTPIPDVVDEEKSSGLVSWGSRRSVIEGNTTYTPKVILAASRTYRKDPLNGNKRYTGGWNISNKHYRASVAFTAAPLFVIAFVWFVGFGICLCLSCLCYCCRGRKSYGYSRAAYALSPIFLVLFTITAIIGCVVLYTGQNKFHGSTTNTLEYVVQQANSTVESLRNVSDALVSAKQIGIDRVYLPSETQTKIDQTQTEINAAATNLADRTEKNSKQIRDVLDNKRLALIVIAAVMLLLVFLGFLFSVLGIRYLLYFLVIIGWFLVAGTFILGGIFLVFHNVVGDTCVAMDEWVQYQTANTALDDILPCVDSATANDTLFETKEVTFQLVNLVNQVITNVSNINFAPNFTPLYYNQSGPLMPLLCNPFHPDMTDRNCDAGEVDLNNATLVWSNYVCEVSPAGICTTVGRVTPDYYGQMTAAVDVSNGLNNYGPNLVQLADCTFVRDTFVEINTDHCPGLRRYSKWIYIGLVMVSSAVMLSSICWVLYARERRHRSCTKKLDAKEPLEGEKGT